MDEKSSTRFVIIFVVLLAAASAIVAFIMIKNYSKDSSKELSKLTRELKKTENEDFVYNEQRGLEVYNQFCVRCHLPSGQGGAAAPPLAGSAIVKGDKKTLIKLVLKGMNGKIERQGKVYNLSMPGFPFIPVKDLAQALSYIRKKFGNEASAVELKEVLKVKIQTIHRNKPWTEKELLAP